MSHANGYDVKFLDVCRNILSSNLYRAILLITLLFGAGSHIFINNVFDSFHDELMFNILDESKKVGKHIYQHQDVDTMNNLIHMSLHQIQDDFKINKIKLFDKDGYVVFSTDQADIGTKNSNQYFYTNVANGEIYYKIVKKDDKTLDGQISFLDVAEIYIPIIKNGKFEGASEIYYDITNKKSSLNSLINTIGNIYMTVLIFLTISIILVLYKSSIDDLTNKRMEQKAKELDILMQQQSRLAAMGEMMGNIAHQWRQPLTAITASISGLKLKKDLGIAENSDIDIAHENISKSADFLSKTIDDFRNFFKKDKTKENFNISKTIINTLNIMKSTYDSNNIKSFVDLDESITFCGVDSLLSQVILNLLTNAKDVLISHNIPNRCVKISLHKKEELIILSIQDNAGGVPDLIIDKIFDPYFTTKHQSVGTGLGLYMSMQIIKNDFDGFIKVENTHDEELGNGARFEIGLPSASVRC